VFESLVITLREGIEAALVVGIILTYLDRTGRAGLRGPVFAGLGLGVAASVAGAWLVSALGIDEERYEGWLMLAGAAFVLSMVWWMWRTARHLRQGIENRVEQIARGATRGVGWWLGVLTFFLILREGIETVLFLAAVDLTTDALRSFAGGLVGLGLAVAFGVAFVRGTVRIDLGRFFKVTEIVIGPIVKNDVLVLVVLLALPLLVLVVPGRREKQRAAAADRLEGPERRLALAALRRDTLWRRTLAAAGILVIASLSVSYAFTRLPQGIDPPSILSPAAGGDEIRLPKSGLDDGHLHRFGVSIDGTVVRFVVMKSGQRVVPVFDACVVCGAHGYVERKGRLVCLACAADINPATIGTGGGCNPIPLRYRDDGGDLVIALKDLAAERPSFQSAAAAASAAPRR
jgi:FTR1 family protein